MKPLYYVIIISYVIVTNCETLRLQDPCSNLNSPPPYHPIRSVWFQHNLKRTSSSYQWQCCWTFVIIAYNPTARHANIRSYNSPFQTGKLSFANIWQRGNESYEAYRSHSSEPWIMIASHASHIIYACARHSYKYWHNTHHLEEKMQKLIRLHHLICKHKPFPVWFS